MTEAKPYNIPKRLVWEAYQRVKANRGAAGVDGVSLAAFERDLKGNLYKIWNRMSSGAYHPPPVRLVEIPKEGGTRPLGIPTISDRVAQTVVKMVFEPEVERYFHPDSCGYRPGRSALDAVGTARKRCWATDWVIDLDKYSDMLFEPVSNLLHDRPPMVPSWYGRLFDYHNRESLLIHIFRSHTSGHASTIISKPP